MAKAKTAPQGGFTFRLLIMLFALALVVIGVYPIRKRLRGSVTDIRRFLQANLPDLPPDRAADGSRDEGSRFTFGDTSREEAAEPPMRRPERVTVDPSVKKRTQLDRISPDERKQLSELVNSF